MKKRDIIAVVALLATMLSCSPSLPDKYTKTGVKPQIYPDYTDVTIPVNIAPLVFEIKSVADEYVTRVSSGDKEFLYSGAEVVPSFE